MNKIKKTLGGILAISLFVFGLSSCASNSSEGSGLTGEQTITGEVVDLSCYLGHGAKGADHAKCAKGCILEKNLPAGILTENGQVYLLIEDHDAADAYTAAIQHAAENVTVSGKVVNKNGVQGLLVEKVEG